MSSSGDGEAERVMHRIRPEIQAFWAQIFNQARLNRSGWIRFGVLLQDGSLKKVQTVTDDQVDYGPENQLDGAAE